MLHTYQQTELWELKLADCRVTRKKVTEPRENHEWSR